MNFLRFAMLFVGFAYLLSVIPVMGMDDQKSVDSGYGLGLSQASTPPMDLTQHDRDKRGIKRNFETMSATDALLDSANQRKKRQKTDSRPTDITQEHKVQDNKIVETSAQEHKVQDHNIVETPAAISSGHQVNLLGLDAKEDNPDLVLSGETMPVNAFSPEQIVQLSADDTYSRHVPFGLIAPLPGYSVSPGNTVPRSLDFDLSNLFETGAQLNTFVFILNIMKNPHFTRNILRDQALYLKKKILERKHSLRDVECLMQAADYYRIEPLKLACHMILAEHPEHHPVVNTWRQDPGIALERSLQRRRFKPRHVPQFIEHHITGTPTKLTDVCNEQGDLLLHRLFKHSYFTSLIMANAHMIKDLRESDLFKIEQQTRRILQNIIDGKEVKEADLQTFDVNDEQKALANAYPNGLCFNAQGKPLSADCRNIQTYEELKKLNLHHTIPLLCTSLQALGKQLRRNGSANPLYQNLEQTILELLENPKTVIATPRKSLFQALAQRQKVRDLTLQQMFLNIGLLLYAPFFSGFLLLERIETGQAIPRHPYLQALGFMLLGSIIPLNILFNSIIKLKLPNIRSFIAQYKPLRTLQEFFLADKIMCPPPLSLAINAQSPNVVGKLLNRGVNVHEVHDGKNAFELAQQPDISQEIKDLVTNAGGKEQRMTKYKRFFRANFNRICVFVIVALPILHILYARMFPSYSDDRWTIPNSFHLAYRNHREQTLDDFRLPNTCLNLERLFRP